MAVQIMCCKVMSEKSLAVSWELLKVYIAWERNTKFVFLSDSFCH